jgi:hypothetical protein
MQKDQLSNPFSFIILPIIINPQHIPRPKKLKPIKAHKPANISSL